MAERIFPGFFLIFVGKVPRKSSRKIPAKSSKIYTIKILRHISADFWCAQVQAEHRKAADAHTWSCTTRVHTVAAIRPHWHASDGGGGGEEKAEHWRYKAISAKKMFCTKPRSCLCTLAFMTLAPQALLQFSVVFFGKPYFSVGTCTFLQDSAVYCRSFEGLKNLGCDNSWACFSQKFLKFHF